MHTHDQPEHQLPAVQRGQRPVVGEGEDVRVARPAASSPEMLLALQRSIGNRAVTGLIAEHTVQRSAVHEVLRAPGQPLDEPTRTEMEARLGADFSDVRLHTDAAARDSAAEVGARAYTSGSHVVLGDGRDRHTLAHELVHVVQQRSGPVAGTDNGSGLTVSDPSDRFEREAEQTATRALSRPVDQHDQAPRGRQEPRQTQALQRAPADLSAAQRSLNDLAGRWKTQSFFALTTGRSNELQRVDQAVANWRRAVNTDPTTPRQDLLLGIQQAINDWRTAKGGGSRSFRAAHINSLDTRVARVLSHAGGSGADQLEEEPAHESEGSEDEYFDEELSEWDAHSAASEPETGDPGWVFSTSNQMAISSRAQTQDFFATPTLIATANAALAARQSPLQLRLSANDVPGELAQQGLRKVEPVMVVNGTELTGTDLLTVDQCIAVARKVTGDQVGNVLLAPEHPGGERVRHKQNPDEIKGFTPFPRLVTRPGMTSALLARNLMDDNGYMQFSWRDARIDVNLDDDLYDGELDAAKPGIRTQLTAAGMTAEIAETLLDAMGDNQLEFHPGLQQILVDRLETAGLLDGDLTTELTGQIRAAAKNVTNLAKSRYRPYDAPDADRDRRLGINDAAAPEVGEAFGIFSTRGPKQEEQAAGKAAGNQPPWTYHFAGVVAKDGDDVVTLENYNRRGKAAGERGPNERWYFALYGPGRTFHDTHRETVTGAITLAMG